MVASLPCDLASGTLRARWMDTCRQKGWRVCCTGSWQTPAASTEVGTRETGDVDVATCPQDVPARLRCLSYGFLRGQFAAAQGLS